MMHPILNIAIRAARMAGSLIIKHYEILDTIKVNQKDNYEFVANIEHKVKSLIIEVIHKTYPQHTVANDNYNVQWIINPLDGTTNFIKRFPHFAVSIAVRIKGRIEVAVVYDPINNELFTTARGQGAQLNGYRLRGGTARNLYGTILAIGFPFKQKQHSNNYITLLKKLFIQCTDFRSTGSTVLDLAYVAAGRVDGFFKIDLNPWNFASGELLVREAGGLVTDFIGGHNYLLSGKIVAGNPCVVKAMLLAIRDNLNETLKY